MKFFLLNQFNLVALVAFVLIWCAPLFGQSIHYKIAMPEPSRHLFHITILIENPGVLPLHLSLPAWNATYLVRNFSKYLTQLQANVEVRRIDKQTWRLDPAGASRIQVNYTVFANEGNPFSSQLNKDHAFLNNANLLLLWREQRNLPLSLEVKTPPDWTIATSLQRSSGDNVFIADNYDHLVDSPIDIGELTRLHFTVRDTPIHVSIDGGHSDADALALVEMLETIVNGHVNLMGDVPFDYYYFLYHFTEGNSGGGMEHRDSTAIHKKFIPGKTSITSLAGVSSHEFFHLWNVKRIRSEAMEPIDYFKEDYSTALWFSEGFTSYYGDLVLKRTGILSREEYYQSLARQIELLQSRTGRYELSAAEVSLLTWFDNDPYYRKKENSFSYYNKGLLIALLFDFKIRHATDNQFTMDDVMRHLNESYAKKGKYFDDDYGIARAITETTGLKLDSLYRDFVHRKVDLPYEKILRFAGLELIAPANDTSSPVAKYQIREITNPTSKQIKIRESWLAGRVKSR